MDPLREEARQYVELLYRSHREDDMLAWNRLIDVLFLYIDQKAQEHERKYHHGDSISE